VRKIQWRRSRKVIADFLAKVIENGARNCP
jgi:hypothetical protein